MYWFLEFIKTTDYRPTDQLTQSGTQTKISEVSWNKSTSVKVPSKIQEKKAGKISECFLLDTLKTKFWMVNLTQGWTESGPFLQNQVTFFHFHNRAREASPLPPPSCESVNTYWSTGKILFKRPKNRKILILQNTNTVGKNFELYFGLLST